MFLFILLFAGHAPAREADPWWAKERGITQGVLVAGSKSPDGKHALFEYFRWDGETADSATTYNGIGLAPVDRSKLLFRIKSRTKWETDKEVTSFLNVRWSPDSSLLATHDSLDKHSKLSIYRISDGRATEFELPDLLALAAKKLGIDPAKATASGQVPQRWREAGVLEVAVRITTAAKGKLTTPLQVHVDPQGKVSVQ